MKPQQLTDEELIIKCDRLISGKPESFYIVELISRFELLVETKSIPKSKTGAPGSVYIEGIHQEHKKDQNAWLIKAVFRFIPLVIVGLVFLWQAFPIIFMREPIESTEVLFWIGVCFAALMFEFVNFCNKSTK